MIRTGHDPELGCGLMLAAFPGAVVIVIGGWLLLSWFLSLGPAVRP